MFRSGSIATGKESLCSLVERLRQMFHNHSFLLFVLSCCQMYPTVLTTAGCWQMGHVSYWHILWFVESRSRTNICCCIAVKQMPLRFQGRHHHYFGVDDVFDKLSVTNVLTNRNGFSFGRHMLICKGWAKSFSLLAISHVPFVAVPGRYYMTGGKKFND